MHVIISLYNTLYNTHLTFDLTREIAMSTQRRCLGASTASGEELDGVQ